MPATAARRVLRRRGLWETWLLLTAFAFLFVTVLTARAEERVVRDGDRTSAGAIADQRRAADGVHRLGPLPRPLAIADAVRRPGP
ncbi:hypothetical protein [Methylobacterium sp. WSM2598]|uniref:hypothetical protein n=1 Tax=Methylobacterium sp. WSM2598 TaxID=398261 RepID=UPI00055B7986|nr:hypothetical protein [Methylobacterium sp. WSM2598]